MAYIKRSNQKPVTRNQIGRMIAISISKQKGVKKENIPSAYLVEDFGMEGDVHAGPGLRQVSLLAIESIRKQTECPQAKKKNLSFGPGDFAENITTEDLDLKQLKIGDKLNIGPQIILEISKIGKECHKYCAIYYKLGDCIMPREAIFAKVLKSGKIAVGDKIELVKKK